MGLVLKGKWMMVLLWLACQNAEENALTELFSLAEQGASRSAFSEWKSAQPSPQSADLLLLRAAVQRPHQGMIFCGLTTTKTAQEKCRQVIGRPHLSATPAQ